MYILVLQILILGFIVAAIVLWAACFPYPSPLLRRFLPERLRWPEAQVRKWINSGQFHPAFLKYFYRDPERNAPEGNDLLSPADGVIISTEVQNRIRYLVIALSFWDMHIQRSPATGTVGIVESYGTDFINGEGREFAFLREKHCPVQKRITLIGHSDPIAVRLITSFAARRIELFVKAGDQVTRGQRIGRILLGSTVVLELSADTELLVQPGDRVWAGETPIARQVVTI